MIRRCLALLAFPAALAAWQAATAPGEVTTPYPTIRNLAVEWGIRGDDNQNGIVEVDYRAAGNREWHRAMPLRRIPAGEWQSEQQRDGARQTFSWSNRHSGSIFDLEPDTEYEIRLRLSDPDGGSGERFVRARTRPVPREAPDARVIEVGASDLVRAAEKAEPGDVLLLAPGRYGNFAMMRDGEPGRPIVIRGDRDYGVWFDSISLQNRKHVHVENVTVDGSIDLLGGESLAVRYAEVNAKYGIIAKDPPGAVNCYVADNTVNFIMPWVPAHMGARTLDDLPASRGEGIQITGPGNVIAHNRVTGFRDCISTMEGNHVHAQVGIDIYNNDLNRCVDDAIEADFAMGNVRVLRNRITNSFIGLSSQPGLGGPTYFVRNVMYNLIGRPFKLMRGSVGDVILHNTSVKVGTATAYSMVGKTESHALLRNNLVIGGAGAGKYGRYSTGDGYALEIRNIDPTFDFDHNGVGTYGIPIRARYGNKVLDGLEAIRRGTPYRHLIEVGMDVFDNVAFPNPPIPERPAPDLRPKAGSAAVDAGVVLLNISNGYEGAAPDLGAYEGGQPLPHYGPRPRDASATN